MTGYSSDLLLPNGENAYLLNDTLTKDMLGDFYALTDVTKYNKVLFGDIDTYVRLSNGYIGQLDWFNKEDFHKGLLADDTLVCLHNRDKKIIITLNLDDIKKMRAWLERIEEYCEKNKISKSKIMEGKNE